MSNFSQKHTKITTFYLLQENQNTLKSELRHHSKWKKAVLIVPLLATEFTDPANRPVFQNILKQLRSASFLSRIVFGLDQASELEARDLARLLSQYGMKNCLIQHNDGPAFSSIYDQLSNAGFGLDVRGKGRNMFLSFGIAMALGAQSIGILDADIRTFRRNQLDRLFYPVQVLNYQFSKAFYARLQGRQMYGRVKRLLLDPLLIALKRKFTDTQEAKILRLVDFLLHFHYQLSGEVVFDESLLKRMRFAMNWGVEIFTLIEVYRKATNIAQVEISTGPFDHKHQMVSPTDSEKGLHKMVVDIVTTLLSALVIDEGLDISDYFIRDLTVTYLDVADTLVKMYADNAAFSGLEYETNSEESMVHGVVKDAILHAGDLLISPYRLVNRFTTFVATHDAFKPFIANGLLEAIAKSGQQARNQLFETPQTVSWERVLRKLPNILYDIIDVVEEEKARFFSN
jgi:glucosyl-3-phosphoglycerate synthase